MRAASLLATSCLGLAIVVAGCQKAAETPAGAPANNPADAANNVATTGNSAAATAEDATAAAVGSVAAPAAATTSSGFVEAAAISDMYEIAAAHVARDKSTNPAIKSFAGKMIHDHTASTAALKKALASGAVTATPPGEMDERRKGLIENLQKAAPADFDKTYMDQQVAAHGEASTLFNNFAEHGDNAALKAFALATAPTIQAHLAMAKTLRDGLK